jgi:hypothetical protein
MYIALKDISTSSNPLGHFCRPGSLYVSAELKADTVPIFFYNEISILTFSPGKKIPPRNLPGRVVPGIIFRAGWLGAVS